MYITEDTSPDYADEEIPVWKESDESWSSQAHAADHLTATEKAQLMELLKVRTFLGLSGYYRRFIPQYSTIASPLTDLTKKSAPNDIEWTADCDRAFQQLKSRLYTAPILASPDFNRQFL